MVVALRGTSDDTGKEKYAFFTVDSFLDKPKKVRVRAGNNLLICAVDKYDAKRPDLPTFDIPKNMKPALFFKNCTLLIEKKTQIKWENGPKNVIDIVMNGLRSASNVIESPKSFFEFETHEVKNDVLEINIRFFVGAIKKRKDFEIKCQKRIENILNKNKIKFSKVVLDLYPAGLKIKIYPPIGSEEVVNPTSWNMTNKEDRGAIIYEYKDIRNGRDLRQRV